MRNSTQRHPPRLKRRNIKLKTSNLCYFIAMPRPREKDLTSLKQKVEHKRAQAKQSVGMHV